MADGDDKLLRRIEQAFARIDKRVKKIESLGVTRQQLEDLLKLVPAVADLKTRVTRIENQLTHAKESRTRLIENDNLIASEMCFIRDRLLEIEGNGKATD